MIPTGYSFNLDGTAIYLTMAAVFIAQACDVNMTIMQQVTLLAVLLLTSKGAAGVTARASLCWPQPFPLWATYRWAGLALILGIDRFMSEARALTNMIGNGIACVVVGHWCGEVKNEALHMYLSTPSQKAKYYAADQAEHEEASKALMANGAFQPSV